MALSPQDQKRLRLVLDLAHALEADWTRAVRGATPSTLPESLAGRLSPILAAVEACAAAEAPDLKRLTDSARHLKAEMSLKHFIAVFVPFERLSSRSLRDDDFLVLENDRREPSNPRHPLIVVADNIRSSFNIGAIFRTAECLGLERVVLTGYSSTPSDEKTARTSMGTADFVPWESHQRIDEALKPLRDQGYRLVALETVESAPELPDFKWPERCALILGNERFGLDPDVLSAVDEICRIPVHGRKNSLNVGIAFGIAAYDWLRQNQQNSCQHSDVPADSALSTLHYEPIGVFHSHARFPYEARRQGAADASGSVGVIELQGGRQFEQALEDLHGFDRIWILYDFHHNPNWKPKVLPPRGSARKRGVFATRAPYRPNPIGLSCVELLGVEGRKVFVRGHDLLDGTPVLDLKPYIPYADAFPNARTGWLQNVEDTKWTLLWSDSVQIQLEELERLGVNQLRAFCQAQLEFDPIDSNRKRVESQIDKTGSTYTLAYRTWRVDFSVTPENQTVTVHQVRSGYSSAELNDPADPYADKDQHRAYLASSGGI